MNIQRVVLGFFSFLMIANCSYNWGQFKKYSVGDPVVELEVVGERVSGRDCGFFPTRWYSNSIAEATREALKSVPNATGLKDVDVSAQSYQYGPFGSCIKVEGIPVREVVVAPGKPTKKK
ncbi:hypothetical protein [Leptospira kmetyi]|uniref:hypothetical protein n=1 Tax=Leptospira kmetyi TaxID=408139 RepID=UPI003EBA3D63